MGNKIQYSEKVVYLEINSWRGISIGAQHYYGHLMGYSPDYQRIELKRKLTAKQADALNESRARIFPGEEHPYLYGAGDITNGFDTESQVRRFAARVFQKHFPKATVLIEGSSSYIEPHLCLVGSKEFKAYSKRIVAKCESLGWFDKGNDDEVEALTDEWYEALEKEANYVNSQT